MQAGKRKKDFKLKEELVVEFEQYAPSGKQTAIVEMLIADWVEKQKQARQQESIRKAYDRVKTK